MVNFGANTNDILDRYSPDMFLLEDGEPNRELGRQLLKELQTGQSVLPIEHTALGDMGAKSSTTLSIEIPSDKKRSKISQPKNITDIEANRTAVFGALIASLLEFERPLAPIDPVLIRNPRARLKAPSQINRFITYMQDRQPITLQDIEGAASQLGSSKNDINTERCVVAIPVAGHQEYLNIYHTLSQFTKQDLPQNMFEVVLGVNLPAPSEISGSSATDESALASELSKTLSEIERFKEDNPGFPVRYYTHAYRGAKPPIGKIRADLWAAIGLDAHERGIQTDPLIISSDADIRHLNRGYLSSMVNTQAATGAEIVTASLRWQMAPGLPYDAPVNKVLMYQTFLDTVRDRTSPYLHTADANTGIAASTYFGIGGYHREAKLGEMKDIVWRVRSYRNSRSTTENAPVRTVEAKAPNAVLKTHSRRLIQVMAMGYTPYRAWDQNLITFGTDDALRTEEMQVQAANEQAAVKWKSWVKSETPYYTQGLSITDTRRILKSARRVLKIEDLYR